MATWKELRALDSAARAGQSQLELARRRGARDAATTSAVLAAVNQLLSTGVDVGGQLYQGASDNLAQDILSGRESFEAPQAPSFADDPLGATAAFLGSGIRSDAQRKATARAQEMAPQRFEAMAPGLVDQAARVARGDVAEMPADGMGPPVPRDVRIDNALDDDPVLSLLPESMRASYRAQVSDLGQAKVQSEDDRALTRKVQTGQLDDRSAKYLGMALASDARAALEPGGSIADLDAKAAELAPELGDLERQSAVQAALQSAKENATNQQLAQAKIAGYLAKASSKKDEKKVLAPSALDGINAKEGVVRQIADLNRFRQENADKINWSATAKYIDALKSLPAVGDAFEVADRIGREANLNPETREFLRRAGALNFAIASGRQTGVMTDSDWRMWQGFLAAPVGDARSFNLALGDYERQAMEDYRNTVRDYSEFYKVPQRHLAAAGKASKPTTSQVKNFDPESEKLLNTVKFEIKDWDRNVALFNRQTGEVEKFTPEEAKSQLASGQFVDEREARNLGLKLRPGKTLGITDLPPGEAVGRVAEGAKEAGAAVVEGAAEAGSAASRALRAVSDFGNEIDAKLGEIFSPTYGLSVRDADVLQGAFSDEAKKLYVERRQAGDSADVATAKVREFVGQKARELRDETAPSPTPPTSPTPPANEPTSSTSKPKKPADEMARALDNLLDREAPTVVAEPEPAAAEPSPAEIRQTALQSLLGDAKKPAGPTMTSTSKTPEELLAMSPAQRRRSLTGEYGQIWSEQYNLALSRALRLGHSPREAEKTAQQTADDFVAGILEEDAEEGA